MDTNPAWAFQYLHNRNPESPEGLFSLQLHAMQETPVLLLMVEKGLLSDSNVVYNQAWSLAPAHSTAVCAVKLQTISSLAVGLALVTWPDFSQIKINECIHSLAPLL